MFVSWLKFYCLGFFSNRISREAPQRGWWNCLLSFALAALFIIGGFLLADALTLDAHYGRASDFRHAVRSVFTDNDISFAIKNGELKAGRDEFGESKLVDTFIDENDKAKYGGSGYGVVLDTRDPEAYDDFYAYCVARDGSGNEITYEEYLGLSAAAKAEFEFKVRYGGDELVLNEEKVNWYKEYLRTADDGKYAEELAAAENIEEPDKMYRAVYELYVKSYYPSMKDYERDGVPKLRNYYLREYVQKRNCDKYLFIFGDSVIASFSTDGGIDYALYGFYGKGDRALNFTSAESADDFMLECFKAGKGFGRTMMVLNLFQLMPIYIFGVIALTLVLILTSRLIKSDIFVKSADCFKTTASFLWMTSLVSSICTLIIGFAVGTAGLFLWTSIIFFTVLTLRLIALIIGEKARLNKLAANQENKICNVGGSL